LNTWRRWPASGISRVPPQSATALNLRCPPASSSSRKAWACYWWSAGSLFTPAMQNRRIIDSIFRAAGTEVRAVMETNSIVTLWSHIRFGPWSTVVPHTFLLLLGLQSEVIALRLSEPDASQVIGLAIRDGEPVAPLARELVAIARQLDLSSEIERQIANAWPAILLERPQRK
jgi:hypothetical protein